MLSHADVVSTSEHQLLPLNNSSRKTIKSRCSTHLECSDTLQCNLNKCQCSTNDYWNQIYCTKRKSVTMSCKIENECQEGLRCSESACSCPTTKYLNDNKCLTKKDLHTDCESSVECKDTLSCRKEHVVVMSQNSGKEQPVSKTLTSYDTEMYKANETINGTIVEVIKTMVTGKHISSAASTNILGLLIASAIFGIATASTKEIGQPFFKFFYSATEIILVILGKLIW
ncbi:unnamed protein product [Mytilus edulis]|uniref:Amino acid transporter n=1 Tax=Mytilus edulis TaxID=6550 RepID=A0A8S3UG91_MYTED|nr:unnamed protein product [Mytilus edulis]